jgi:putative tricarboxylic transport membrane protein
VSQETGYRGTSVLENVLAALLVPFSIFYIWQGMQVTEPPRNIIVGPRTFPVLIGVFMLSVSALLAWRRIRMHVGSALLGKGQETAAVPLEDEELLIKDWPAVWLVLGSLLALVVLFETLGFVAGNSLFIFGLSTVFAPRHWLMNLAVALGFSLSFFYLFTNVLGIPLPTGVLQLFAAGE